MLLFKTKVGGSVLLYTVAFAIYCPVNCLSCGYQPRSIAMGGGYAFVHFGSIHPSVRPSISPLMAEPFELCVT